MNAAQIRMARAGLSWSLADLARTAGLDSYSVGRVEHDIAAGSPEMLRALRQTLEAAGVTFIEHEDGGFSVRFADGSRPMAEPRPSGRDRERDAEIVRRRQAGETFVAIGKDLGISSGRVSGLYNRELHTRKLSAGRVEVLSPD